MSEPIAIAVLSSTNASSSANSGSSSNMLTSMGSGDRGGSGVKDGGGSGASKPTNAVAVDDRLYVFEAVGLLLGQDEIPSDQQALLLGSLLQPLKDQIESSLSYALPAPTPISSPSASPLSRPESARLSMQMASGLIIQSLEAIVRLSKGFRTDVLIRARPQLGSMFLSCFQTAIGSLKVFPTHRLLRSRFVTSVHRLVEGLGAAMLPHLPLALETLISLIIVSPSPSSPILSPNAISDLIEVIALTNQLVIKFKEGIVSLLQVLLPVLISRILMVIGAWDWSGRSSLPAAACNSQLSTVTLDETREKTELQKSFYSLIHVTVNAGLSSILLKISPSPPSSNQPIPPPGSLSAPFRSEEGFSEEGYRGASQVLDTVISSIITGSSHVDPTVRRTCLQILTRLTSDWCGGGGGGGGGGLGTVASTTTTGSSGGAKGDDGGMDVSSSSPTRSSPLTGAIKSSQPSMAMDQSTSNMATMAAELVPGFRRFAIDTIATEACIIGLFSGSPIAASGQVSAMVSLSPSAAAASIPLLDPKDAATNAVLGEVASLLKLVASLCCPGGGGELGSHLLATSLPRVGLPLELQHQVAVCLRDCETRELREALKASLAWLVNQSSSGQESASRMA